MSKLTVLNDAIEKLETAEIAVGNAKRAFPLQSMECDMLDREFKSVGDAVITAKRVLARVEKEMQSYGEFYEPHEWS